MSASATESARVAILLCTYNGAEFLEQQIETFLQQTHLDWTILVSDDGSTDGTHAILSHYQQQLGEERFKLYKGPRQGFAKNFMSLARHANGLFDFYAFSDQDDLWFPDKLARSLASLRPVAGEVPGVYCSRTRLVNAAGEVIGHSPLFPRPATFQNALVQSIAGANTMLVNQRAMSIICQTPDHLEIVAHDWLTYLLTTAAGGVAIYDSTPSIDYRQHEKNVIGANTGMLRRILRLHKMLGGRSKNWSNQNLAILQALRHVMPDTPRQTLDNFITGRNSSLPKRLCLMKKAGIYRQTLPGNLSLFLAVVLNKI